MWWGRRATRRGGGGSTPRRTISRTRSPALPRLPPLAHLAPMGQTQRGRAGTAGRNRRRRSRRGRPRQRRRAPPRGAASSLPPHAVLCAPAARPPPPRRGRRPQWTGSSAVAWLRCARPWRAVFRSATPPGSCCSSRNRCPRSARLHPCMFRRILAAAALATRSRLPCSNENYCGACVGEEGRPFSIKLVLRSSARR